MPYFYNRSMLFLCWFVISVLVNCCFLCDMKVLRVLSILSMFIYVLRFVWYLFFFFVIIIFFKKKYILFSLLCRAKCIVKKVFHIGST